MVVEMDDATREQVRELFTGIVNDVKAHLFLEERDCLYCNDVKDKVEQLAELSDMITIVEHRDLLIPVKQKSGASSITLQSFFMERTNIMSSSMEYRQVTSLERWSVQSLMYQQEQLHYHQM